MGFSRVVTHYDFDGVVCAALCSHIYGMENIFFTGPRDIQTNRHPITEQDIVTDLPYPMICGMWFDHHPGNLQDVKLRGIESEKIPGRFHNSPSCARTVHDYFSEEWEMADYLELTVAEADIIDAFDYSDVNDWRKPTPGKNVDASIKAPFDNLIEKNRFLKKLTLWIRDYSLVEIEKFSEVVQKREKFEEVEAKSLEIIRQVARFLPEDLKEEIVIIDLTGFRIRPHIAKHMAYLEYRESKAAIVISNPVMSGLKTTNLTLSMSLSVTINQQDHGKDIGEIMRVLNLGDGHAGAGAGLKNCASKKEMIKTKSSLLSEIFDIWKHQEIVHKSD